MPNEKTLQQLIREYELNMPPEILNMIRTFDWRKELRFVVNQNQVMIDVGKDLEESVYLMLLGIVKTEDVYERLIDVHELEADKAQKILEEIDDKIFTVLHKRLVQMDKEDAMKEPVTKPTPEIFQNIEDSNPESRDAILAEIEKETVLPDMGDLKARNIPHPSAPIDTREPVVNFQSKAQDEIEPLSGGKISKPFSISSETDVQVQPTPISSGEFVTPEVAPREVVIGIQKDPVSSGLNNMTAMTPQPSASVPQNPPQVRASDPYREPIE